MRIVLLSGIWPPDVGGPATHGPDVARFLAGRGHDVRVVTMGDGPPSDRPCPVTVVPRTLPFPLRYGRVAATAARFARRADVLYATATYAAAALAARASRRPLVAKLVSDPAYERAVRYGLYAGPLEGLAGAPGVRLAALRRARTAALRTAARVTVPSAYLARLAAGFGLDPARVEVLPNPAPAELPAAPAPQPPGTLVFVGRLTRQKGLGTALAALARVPAARLLLVGEGPEREALEARARELGLDGRVAFLGALPRVEALALVAGAEAALLASDWENLPHAAVEALAVGTPVVATAVGGVPEVVDDGVNGLLVPPGDPEALARAVERVLVEPGLRERLAAAASPSVAPLDRDAVYGRLERILLEAAA